MSHHIPTYSIIIPVYRSQSTLIALYKRLVTVMKSKNNSFEIIFVDDDSPDNSWKILTNLYKNYKDVCLIQLTRNFGQHNAIMCGIAHSKGDYIITMDDDLQNPPEDILKLINKMNQGFDIVYGEYKVKKHSFLRNIGSHFVQYVYKRIFQVSGNLTSFRIIRRHTAEKILDYKLNYTFIDGLLAWQTKNIGYVLVNHHKRTSGKSNYGIEKLFVLTFNMITNFSIFPLQLASITGFLFSFLGGLLAIFFTLKKIFFGIPVTGYTSIIIAILIFSGVQLVTIGLIGEYIGRIHLNMNQKPQYSIRSVKDRKNDTVS